MADLLSHKAKICLTAAGCLIHDGKVLLIQHKKLQTWLNPGGHSEPGELPHQTAEREFFEETGVKVEAYSPSSQPTLFDASERSQFLPNPIATNLHCINKGTCEQHLSFLYLVQPVGSLEMIQNNTETTGIGWFAQSELQSLNLFGNVQQELKLAFQIAA